MKKPFIQKVQKDLSIPWFEQIKKTVVLPDKPEKEIFYSIKPPDYVTALAETEDKKFFLLKQYRPAVDDYTYELPSGHMEKGETPTQAMIRELEEETNCRPDNLTLLGEIIPDTGRLENRLWAFYTNDIKLRPFLPPSENDGIHVQLISHEALSTMIIEGRFNHALDLSIIALAILKKHLTL